MDADGQSNTTLTLFIGEICWQAGYLSEFIYEIRAETAADRSNYYIQYNI